MAITTVHQPSYDQYHSKGYAGQIAVRSIQPLIVRGFTAALPTDFNASNPRNARARIEPGDGVWYDNSVTDGRHWKLPSSSTTHDVVGVVGYEQSNRPSQTNAATGAIEIGANAPIKVIIEGIVWVTVGEAVEFGDLLHFAESSASDTAKMNRWLKYTIDDSAATAATTAGIDTAVDTLRDNLQKRAIYALTDGAAGSLVQARIVGTPLR